MSDIHELAAKLGLRASTDVTFTPEAASAYARKHAGRQMGAHIGDIEVAGKVRMLMRDDIDHEAVVRMARDRICALHVEKAELLSAVRDWMSPYDGFSDYELERRFDPATLARIKRTRSILAKTGGAG